MGGGVRKMAEDRVGGCFERGVGKILKSALRESWKGE